MELPRLLLVAVSVGLGAVLVRAVIKGNLHSKYSLTYRDENPGTFWALWIALLVPLIGVLLLVLRLHPALRR
jgi:hypothetical protein